MGGKHRELLVLCFSGRRLEEDDYTIYTCDQAPVVGAGKTEEEADHDMYAALAVYVHTLLEREELDAFLKDRAVPFVRISAADPGSVDLRCALGPQLAETSETWFVPVSASPNDNGQPMLLEMVHS